MLGPKIGSKTCQQINQFWNPYFSSLEALQLPLENHLEPLMLVLRAPKTQKVWFSICKITLFAIAAFRYFEALEVLLGSSSPHHGLFNSKMAPKMDPKRRPKNRKTCPKTSPLFKFIFCNCRTNYGVHFNVKNTTDEKNISVHRLQDVYKTA